MSRFTFRLQKVLELKERGAQAAAVRLGAAERKADEAQAARDTIAAIRHESGDQQLAAAQEEGSTAGQLQNISFLLETLNERVHHADEQADVARSGVADAQAVLALAQQAKRTLDRLRDRRLDEWEHMLRQTDSQQMDALALSRFARHRIQIQDES